MSNTSKSSVYGNVILALFLTVVAVVASITQAAPPSLTKTTGGPVVTNIEDLEVQKDNYILFYSAVFLEKDKTRISFPFSVSDPSPTIFLGFTPKNDEERFEVLVNHPQLENLTWDKLEDEQLFLYQKRDQYTSVEQFLNTPPELGSISIDSALQSRYPQFSEASITDFSINMDKVDFILTTYSHHPKTNDVVHFETIIDASKAFINEANSIEWYLRSPDISNEVGYRRGHIQINYLQE